MACSTFLLRTEGLTGADPGGTWTNTVGGYTGPLTGDNPSIDFSLLTPGTLYTFQYSGTDCDGNPATADVSLRKLDVGSVGSNATVDLCIGDAPINIANELGATSGSGANYSISGDTGDAQYSNGGSSTNVFDDTFSPVTAGTYTFTITCTPDAGGFTLLACCTSESATLTINVAAQFAAGSGGNYAGC